MYHFTWKSNASRILNTLLSFPIASYVDDWKSDDNFFVDENFVFSSWKLIRSFQFLRILKHFFKLSKYRSFLSIYFVWYFQFDTCVHFRGKISLSQFLWLYSPILSLLFLWRFYWTRFHAHWVYLPYLWTHFSYFISLF